MTVTSLIAIVEPHTGKILKITFFGVFERRENLLQNGILYTLY